MLARVSASYNGELNAKRTKKIINGWKGKVLEEGSYRSAMLYTHIIRRRMLSVLEFCPGFRFFRLVLPDTVYPYPRRGSCCWMLGWFDGRFIFFSRFTGQSDRKRLKNISFWRSRRVRGDKGGGKEGGEGGRLNDGRCTHSLLFDKCSPWSMDRQPAPPPKPYPLGPNLRPWHTLQKSSPSCSEQFVESSNLPQRPGTGASFVRYGRIRVHSLWSRETTSTGELLFWHEVGVQAHCFFILKGCCWIDLYYFNCFDK